MSLALATGDFAVRPSLAFVGFDHVGEGCQLDLLRAVLGAAHQCVGAIMSKACMRSVTSTRCETASVELASCAVVFFAAVVMARTPVLGLAGTVSDLGGQCLQPSPVSTLSPAFIGVAGDRSR